MYIKYLFDVGNIQMKTNNNNKSNLQAVDYFYLNMGIYPRLSGINNI